MNRVRHPFIALTSIALLLTAAASAFAPAVEAKRAASTAPRYLNAVFPKATVKKDLVYGNAVDGKTGLPTDLKLDLYQPANDKLVARPVIVWGHGGAFSAGDKQHPPAPDMMTKLAQRGFVGASINYRLDGSSADAQHDMQAAVRWVRANAAKYHLDPNHIVVAGSSSGAQIALQTNFNPDDPGNSGNPGFPSNVAGAMPVSWSVQTGIDPGDPPIAVFQAFDDLANSWAASEAMCEQMQVKGNVCVLNTYTQGGHGENLIAAHEAEILQQMGDFLCGKILGPAICPTG